MSLLRRRGIAAAPSTSPSSMLPAGWPSVTGLWALFDVNDIGAAYTNGDPVGTWQDLSGAGRDATAPANDNRPLFSDTVFTDPVLTFDGTDDVLVFTGPDGGSVTVMVVGRRRGSAADDPFYSTQAGFAVEGDRTARTYVGANTSPAEWRAFNGTNLLGGALDNDGHVFLARMPTSGDGEIRVDGVSTEGSTGTRVAGQHSHIAAYRGAGSATAPDQASACDLLCVAVFAADLTGTEISDLETWANNYFDLTAAT